MQLDIFAIFVNFFIYKLEQCLAAQNTFLLNYSLHSLTQAVAADLFFAFDLAIATSC